MDVWLKVNIRLTTSVIWNVRCAWLNTTDIYGSQTGSHRVCYLNTSCGPPVLRCVHWLPVCQIIDFKILNALLCNYKPSRPLRSFGTNLLSPMSKLNGEVAFSFYASHILLHVIEISGTISQKTWVEHINFDSAVWFVSSFWSSCSVLLFLKPSLCTCLFIFSF